uniref:DUF7344 domain-containing protein n=1 Tax=Natronococcus wangiae TaxID=3068275 RepID=UPI00273EB26E|nr:hypothetical protein [Natronococcus sp. AD5]
MRAIARSVAAAESGTPITDLSTGRYQRVYTALYRTHLPRLDRAGLIEYERERGLVRPTARLERNAPVLEAPAAVDSSSAPEARNGTKPSDRREAYVAAFGLAGLALSGALVHLSLVASVLVGGLVIIAFLYRTIAAARTP